MVSFRPPVPLTEGFKLRAYNTARILSSKYGLDLLTLAPNDFEPSQAERQKLREVFDSIEIFKNRRFVSKLKSLTALPFPKTPLQTRYYSNLKAKRWLNTHKKKYDGFYCLHLRTAPYLENIEGKKIIDLIDATSRMYEGAKRWSTGFWKALYTLETRRLKAYERCLFHSFDQVVISSKFDRNIIDVEGKLKEKCSVIPNGVRKSLIRSEPCNKQPREKNWIFFLGKMDYAPNVDAVKYFAENQWLQLKAKINSDIEFIIAGTSPRPSIRNLTAIPGVRVTGHLEDPYRLMSKAKVVVVPLRYSAGIQNKVLEAMALGKPVVTTPPGARGIDAEGGKNLIVTEQDNLVNSIYNLWNDAKKRERIGGAARKKILSEYTWEKVKKKLIDSVKGEF